MMHSSIARLWTDVEMHPVHLRRVLALMHKHKLYGNLKKCIFGADEIPVIGCFVGKYGVRPDPEKIRAIVEWSTPLNVKDLCKFFGLATYLHSTSCAMRVISRSAVISCNAITRIVIVWCTTSRVSCDQLSEITQYMTRSSLP